MPPVSVPQIHLTLNRLLLILVLLQGCSEPSEQPPSVRQDFAITESSMPDNPLLVPSALPLGFPAFDLVRDEHFLPAIEQGMAEQRMEVAAIAGQTAPPDFPNTIVALELSGQLLDRSTAMLNNLALANTNDSLRALRQQLAPLLAAHDDAIVHNAALFARISSLYQQRRNLGLDSESLYLLERYHQDFLRAGANLDPEGQRRLRAINQDIAELEIRISQAIQEEANRLAIVVTEEADLAGLSDTEIAAAAQRARDLNLESSFVLALQNTTTQPVLASLSNRALRQYILEVSLSRNSNGGPYDTREALSRLLRLRAEKARLLGYENYAGYVLANQTAGESDVVDRRLAALARPAMANARREAGELQTLLSGDGNQTLEAWDWDFYAERLRLDRYQIDAGELRSYLELENVLFKGLFHAAHELYGLTFTERFDLPVYHPDVRVFEVQDSVGTTLGMFIADLYQRPAKRGGAWNSSYVAQSRLLQQRPVVANHLNIPKPPDGEPTLLSLDEVRTLFHEFGHALHNLFSDVQYPYFAGSRVPRDFVEFPSQVNEMWALWPAVLENYGIHYRTGEPMPPELLQRVVAAEQFNQGYATTEHVAAAILDMALHQLTPEQVPEPGELLQFEAQVLAAAGIDARLVPPRYRVTYFNHIMGGYAAGYYSYTWAEVLDADAVQWFNENGGLTRANGNHFRRTVLSKGGSADALDLYREFRGRDPELQPLLLRRGLLDQN
ncbi:MAG: hypothetical protein RLZZ385_308 [Pseudomonadota bacterium]|jgi:peptidyl-dipeptidase Dcp